MANEPTKEEMFKFLDDLQETGRTNMIGAASYIRTEWPTISRNEAIGHMMAWIQWKEEQEHASNA